MPNKIQKWELTLFACSHCWNKPSGRCGRAARQSNATPAGPNLDGSDWRTHRDTIPLYYNRQGHHREPSATAQIAFSVPLLATLYSTTFYIITCTDLLQNVSAGNMDQVEEDVHKLTWNILLNKDGRLKISKIFTAAWISKCTAVRFKQ